MKNGKQQLSISRLAHRRMFCDVHETSLSCRADKTLKWLTDTYLPATLIGGKKINTATSFCVRACVRAWVFCFYVCLFFVLFSFFLCFSECTFLTFCFVLFRFFFFLWRANSDSCWYCVFLLILCVSFDTVCLISLYCLEAMEKQNKNKHT